MRITPLSAVEGRTRWLPVAVLLLGLLLAAPLAAPARAEGKPFRPPFATPPGPGTWFVSQWYGATIYAARNWPVWYSAGQGVHFGVDLATACGTEVVAIGDGVIAAVDGPYGSAPHNLVIRHANGYSSLYGHLVERAPWQVGQSVSAGTPIARTGDSDAPSCDRAPHLHLEIRYDDMRRTTNPIHLVEAEWGDATLGIRDQGTVFTVDLDQPLRWQTIYDQPDVVFGGPVFLRGSRTWPP
ncbi:MAG: M23 family metallopeptidase [Chloroflexi bacterium]|nr:M23 family metallopeptidase [Chloroflexota bacterium]